MSTGWEIPWQWSICRSDVAPGGNLPYSVSKLRIVDNDVLSRTLYFSVVRYDLSGLVVDVPPQAVALLAGPVDEVHDVNLVTVNAPGERWLRIERSNGTCNGRLVALGYHNEVGGMTPYAYTAWAPLSCGRPYDTDNDTGFPPLMA